MMSYPPGVTQWHIDYYAGGYDEPHDEDDLRDPDYAEFVINLELNFESLCETYR